MTAAPPFERLAPRSFGVILADPPWNFVAGEEKNARQHYRCMSFADIAMLPVRQLAAPNCACFMWVTAPMLADGIAALEAWGFHYKTAGAWAKLASTADDAEDLSRLAFGTGYIFRSAAEFFLVGTTGSPEVRSHSVRNLIAAPRREHSRKPDQLYLDIESLYAGPYLELFARATRAGWDSWGNQVGRFGDVA